MEYKSILTSIMDNVGIVTLNHPQEKDNIDVSMLEELADQLKTWGNDDEIRVVILRGRKSFSSGIDMKNLIDEANKTKNVFDNIKASFDTIKNFEKPIIASVSGYVLGIGLELALACDFVLASDDAKFAHPEISLNTIPCFGGVQRLTKTIGKSKAMEMVLTGRALGAEEAEKCGIVSRIIPAANLLEDTIKTAKRIAGQSVKAIRIAKKTINYAVTGLDDGIELERSNGELCLLDSGFRQSLQNLQKNNNKL